MDVTDTPEGVPEDGETPPSFDDLDSPETVLKGGPTRERLLDVLVQTREPTRVAEIADRADCDPETARDYLSWFTEMGIAEEHEGRPVRYERSESFLRWRRVESIRREYSQTEIVDRLAETVDEIASYRDRFDADTPAAVSLADGDDGAAVAERWEALSRWRTLTERARLLDAARRDTTQPPAAGIER